MKKLFLLTIMALTAVAMQAQDAQSVVLLNYETLKKKVAKSDADIQDAKKSIKANTWVKRGELFQDVFLVGLDQAQEGMGITTFTLFYKEPKSIETETKEDGSKWETYIYPHMHYIFVNGVLQQWKRIDPIHPDPLSVAIEAYKKALELDTKGKIDSKVKENLIELKAQLKRDGVNDYYFEDYNRALKAFENVLDVNSIDLFAGELDTLMVQYSGIISREIAGKTNNMDLYRKAISYYTQLAEAGFGGPNTYLQMKMDYMNLGDTLKAMEVLKEAYEKYPDTVNVVANLADTYIQMKDFDGGIAFMEKAIEANPSIPEFYYWNGRLLINKEEVETMEKAIESYKKAGELKPELYYVWYDLGYIFYLQGADFYERGNQEEHEATREKLLELGKEKYTAAIPNLEKAFKLNKDNRDIQFETLDLLQRIYYKEQMMEDYERVKALKNEI
ncbi:MAG: hypothetical protein CSA96_03700 [Bacteroidetes bacterium]|nr:MAG: hypothetical protein CSA96_03700 [Bacteroidota bacterium]